MLYGNPMSGKTTAAGGIRDYLHKAGMPAEIISSAKLRLKGQPHSSTTGFVDEENARTKKAKDKAYQAMCSAAASCLRKGVVPILDATFHKLYRRKWVYGLATDENAGVYIIWLVFNNDKAIKKCLRERRRAGKVSALHTWEQYIVMRQQADRLEDNELVKHPDCVAGILQFDRDTGKIRLYGRMGGFARKMADALTK